MEIVIDQLTKKYRDKVVLNSIDLTIGQPGVYLIAGPNGSGKTTLLETIVGLRRIDGGSVKINNSTIDDIQLKNTVGFLTQQNTLRKNCTVAEELQLVKELFQLDIDTYQYLEKYNLQDFYHQKTKSLSGGTKRRVLIALLFLPPYKIAVLDEPVSGLDTYSRDEIWNMIREYAQDNIVIVSDHYLNQAGLYSDYVYLMNNGNIILQGVTEEILDKFHYDYVIKTREKYLDELKKKVKSAKILSELKVSGSVYHYFISTENHPGVRDLYSTYQFSVHPITLEDIYFYYTGESVNKEVGV